MKVQDRLNHIINDTRIKHVTLEDNVTWYSITDINNILGITSNSKAHYVTKHNYTSYQIIENNKIKCISVNGIRALLDFIYSNKTYDNFKGYRNEKDLEHEVYTYLTNIGKYPQTQFRCKYGIIDIITNDSIYEVKRNINISGLYTGIGQLILYGSDLNIHNLFLVVPLLKDNDMLREIAITVKQHNIVILQWDNNSLIDTLQITKS